ncbi:hypothetical protein [Pseudooceanicola batsensis]|uniref:hypothetical protein n=1 Tax=Pseudooceanicola batsensis TaxID=314255 RepID=UPI0011D20150|nr:hypothetical protein [Pseudooceanicola batsensis]
MLAELGTLSEVGNLELDAVSDDTANLWLNPRISCHQSLGSLDGVCGYGGSIGVEGSVEDSDPTYAFGLDGEWGDDYFLGSVTLRASRQIGRGLLSGDAGLNAKGDVTMGASFEMSF